MLAKLQSNGLVKARGYKKYRKQILNDAKIQLKRQLGKASRSNNSSNYYNSPLNSFDDRTKVLENYAILLYPFIQEKEVKQFFDRLQFIKDPRIRTTYATLLAKNEVTAPKALLDTLATDINTRILLFNKLKSAGKLNLFPKRYRNPKSLAEALVLDSHRFNAERDSIQFLREQPLSYKGKNYTGYFFKEQKGADYNKNFKIQLVVFDPSEGLTSIPFYKSEEVRIEDTDTDKEAIQYVSEAFTLKDRQRAEVYRPNAHGGYGFNGY